MAHPIWISKGGNLSFQSLLRDKGTYIEAWHTIVTHWMFEPCRHLAGDRQTTDRGIALLMMELAFFEPFGSILTGEDSSNASRKTFSKGLKKFADWLSSRGSIGENERAILGAGADKEEVNVVYSFARCGLMHNFTMQGGQIFIDALGIGKYSITDYEYELRFQDRKGLIQAGEKILLIDPWRLLPEMEEFLIWFVTELRSSGNGSEIYQNFERTFERVIVTPGKIYFGS